MSVPVDRVVVGSTEADRAGSGRPYTVVYDGQCAVCNRLVRLLHRWDKRKEIETVPYQDASVSGRFPWIPPAAYREAMQLVGPRGHTWQGAAAIDHLLGILPGGWLLGWVFRVPVLGRLVDRFYRWFARNRFKFGCGDHCPLRLEQPD